MAIPGQRLYSGEFDLNTMTIEISPHLDDVTSLVVFIHELIHVLHPEWNEQSVRTDVHRLLAFLNMLEYCKLCRRCQ